MPKKPKYFFVFFLFLGIQLAYSQVNIQKVQLADSLFQQKQYTQALLQFENVYNSTRFIAPQALLKMAFSAEATQDYVKALYYLNLYYLLDPEMHLLQQMENLANQYRLHGYEYSDWKIIQGFYQRYFNLILLVITILGLTVVAYWITLNLQHKKVLVRHKIAFFALGVCIALAVNLYKSEQFAIINQDHTYLMDAPSAGANLLKVVEKGHRITVLATQDIWYKIYWNNQIAYIRKDRVLVVEL
jgi:hypothetical protein